MATTSIREASRLTYDFIKTSGALDEVQWRVYDHLFHHGPCTGTELNKALHTGKGRASYHLRAHELVISGCVAEVGKKPVGSDGTTTPMYDVTSRPPDHAKLAAERARVAEQAQKSARPSKAVLQKAIPELLTHCREQRDKNGHKFSPEFMDLCRWLKTLIPAESASKPTAPAAPADAKLTTT